MKYKVRPGVVKVQICGSYLLIPTRAAASSCKEIIQLKLLQTMGWELLSAGRPVDEVYKMFSIFTKKPEEENRRMVDTFLENLYEKGFLIKEEDE